MKNCVNLVFAQALMDMVQYQGYQLIMNSEGKIDYCRHESNVENRLTIHSFKELVNNVKINHNQFFLSLGYEEILPLMYKYVNNEDALEMVKTINALNLEIDSVKWLNLIVSNLEQKNDAIAYRLFIYRPQFKTVQNLNLEKYRQLTQSAKCLFGENDVKHLVQYLKND